MSAIGAGSAENFAVFRDHLHEALTHLHDPDYAPPAILYAVTGCSEEDGAGPVQSAVIRAIETMSPSEDTSTWSASGRDYEILHHRFVLRLTQEETADIMSHSVRHLNRLQREAEHRLARIMWERAVPPETHPLAPPDEPQGPQIELQTDDQRWRDQLRAEMAVLARQGGEATANLASALDGALRIARAGAEGRTISFEGKPELADLTVALHPAVLRQAVLYATAQVTQSGQCESVAWDVRRQPAQVELSVIGRPGSTGTPIDISPVSELLQYEGGTAVSSSSPDDVRVVLVLPSVGTLGESATVLVVDDNPDLAALWRTYLAGTRYEVMHLDQGKDALSLAAATRPGVIVLDVMLPDIDGWDLLLDLRAHPDTRLIPVIVCSVIADETLAISLGARSYIRKPVWREQLIDALDQAISG